MPLPLAALLQRQIDICQVNVLHGPSCLWKGATGGAKFWFSFGMHAGEGTWLGQLEPSRNVNCSICQVEGIMLIWGLLEHRGKGHTMTFPSISLQDLPLRLKQSSCQVVQWLQPNMPKEDRKLALSGPKGAPNRWKFLRRTQTQTVIGFPPEKERTIFPTKTLLPFDPLGLLGTDWAVANRRWKSANAVRANRSRARASFVMCDFLEHLGQRVGLSGLA